MIQNVTLLIREFEKNIQNASPLGDAVQSKCLGMLMGHSKIIKNISPTMM